MREFLVREREVFHRPRWKTWGQPWKTAVNSSRGDRWGVSLPALLGMRCVQSQVSRASASSGRPAWRNVGGGPRQAGGRARASRRRRPPRTRPARARGDRPSRSRIVYTGAIAACAASNAASTSAYGRAPIQAPTMRVELLAVLGSALERREARVVAVRRASVEHAVRDRLGRRRDRDPLAVGALVRAARHGVRDARTEPRLVVVEVRGGRRQRRHHLEHRLEQVDVDDLALARCDRDGAARPSPRTRPRAPRLRR